MIMILILYISDAILICVHGQHWSGCAAAQTDARSAPLPICVPSPPSESSWNPGLPTLGFLPMFRPCIDLHEGKVKQVVGATLDQAPGQLRTNFISHHDAAWYAKLYKDHGLKGGHVIMLGPGNDAQARSAIQSFPGGLQVGGGIHPDNARRWLDDGASHVVVTSWVFSGGSLDWARLAQLVKSVGRERLVLDLSCRRRGTDYVVMMDRWRTFTDIVLESALFEKLARHCSEFLIHAV